MVAALLEAGADMEEQDNKVLQGQGREMQCGKVVCRACVPCTGRSTGDTSIL